MDLKEIESWATGLVVSRSNDVKCLINRIRSLEQDNERLRKQAQGALSEAEIQTQQALSLQEKCEVMFDDCQRLHEENAALKAELGKCRWHKAHEEADTEIEIITKDRDSWKHCSDIRDSMLEELRAKLDRAEVVIDRVGVAPDFEYCLEIARRYFEETK